MNEAFSRTALLIGAEGVETLAAARVAIFGLGGVGSWVAEALARAGVGHFRLVDHDVVSVSNLNRQLVALTTTVGLPKVEVMRERILAINPGAEVEARVEFYKPGDPTGLLEGALSYVVDAIDSISSKLDLIARSKSLGLPVMSSMGAGNKLDPTRLEVADIAETSICPLARLVRRELRKRGIESVKVVYSREPPIHVAQEKSGSPVRRSVPGSISFVPSAAGLVIAAEVVRDLLA